MTQQQTDVACVNICLKIFHTGTCQVRHDVFLGCIESGKNGVCSQRDLVTIEISTNEIWQYKLRNTKMTSEQKIIVKLEACIWTYTNAGNIVRKFPPVVPSLRTNSHLKLYISNNGPRHRRKAVHSWNQTMQEKSDMIRHERYRPTIYIYTYFRHVLNLQEIIFEDITLRVERHGVHASRKKWKFTADYRHSIMLKIADYVYF